MSGRTIDIKGQRFGRLVTIKHIKYKGWLCGCDCGKIKIINHLNAALHIYIHIGFVILLNILMMINKQIIYCVVYVIR